MEINFGDSRSFKMAVVADYYVNPQLYPKLPQSTVVYDRLRDAGYGIIKMPPPSMVGKGLQDWIVTTVDQIQEYSKRGFRIFLLGAEGIAGKGLWLQKLTKEIKNRGIPAPQQVILKRGQLQTSDVMKSVLA